MNRVSEIWYYIIKFFTSGHKKLEQDVNDEKIKENRGLCDHLIEGSGNGMQIQENGKNPIGKAVTIIDPLQELLEVNNSSNLNASIPISMPLNADKILNEDFNNEELIRSSLFNFPTKALKSKFYLENCKNNDSINNAYKNKTQFCQDYSQILDCDDNNSCYTLINHNCDEINKEFVQDFKNNLNLSIYLGIILLVAAILVPLGIYFMQKCKKSRLEKLKKKREEEEEASTNMLDGDYYKTYFLK
ncbi:hypothetical protein H312_02511 [Anncaliia algerae PRA339]|uniref:Uncharacterized protein n=1 Tax=Anncaliia algerae PRA339 TaxID=1288291 RepID=A0A059EZG5_9MICR|nr:hypothetical protein H312_02511 [Anncaliia algerae PRA339]